MPPPRLFISGGHTSYPESHVAKVLESSCPGVLSARVGSCAAIQLSTSADVIILSLRSLALRQEALAIVSALEQLLSTGTSLRPRGILVLSSLLTWECGVGSVREEDWAKHRTPPPNSVAASILVVERNILKLTTLAGAPPVHILGTGLVYGRGEGGALAPLMFAAARAVWDSMPAAFRPEGGEGRGMDSQGALEKKEEPATATAASTAVAAVESPPDAVKVGVAEAKAPQTAVGVPIPAVPGSPLIPCIHADDLSKCILVLAQAMGATVWPIPLGLAKPPYTAKSLPLYMVASDLVPTSAKAIGVAVAEARGDGRWVEVAAGNGGGGRGGGPTLAATQDVDVALFTAHLPPLGVTQGTSVTSTLLTLLPAAKWACPKGIVEALKSGRVGEEWVAARNCTPKRFTVGGTEGGRKGVALALSVRSPPHAALGVDTDSLQTTTTTTTTTAAEYSLPILTIPSMISTFLDAHTPPHALIRTHASSPGASQLALEGLASLRASVAKALEEDAALAQKEFDAAVGAAGAAHSSSSSSVPSSSRPPSAPAVGAPSPGKQKGGAAAAAAAAAAAPPPSEPSPPSSSSHTAPFLPTSPRPPQLSATLLTKVVRTVLTSQAISLFGCVMDGFPRTAGETERFLVEERVKTSEELEAEAVERAAEAAREAAAKAAAEAEAAAAAAAVAAAAGGKGGKGKGAPPPAAAAAAAAAAATPSVPSGGAATAASAQPTLAPLVEEALEDEAALQVALAPLSAKEVGAILRGIEAAKNAEAEAEAVRAAEAAAAAAAAPPPPAQPPAKGGKGAAAAAAAAAAPPSAQPSPTSSSPSGSTPSPFASLKRLLLPTPVASLWANVIGEKVGVAPIASASASAGNGGGSASDSKEEAKEAEEEAVVHPKAPLKLSPALIPSLFIVCAGSEVTPPAPPLETAAAAATAAAEGEGGANASTTTPPTPPTPPNRTLARELLHHGLGFKVPSSPPLEEDDITPPRLLTPASVLQTLCGATVVSLAPPPPPPVAPLSPLASRRSASLSPRKKPTIPTAAEGGTTDATVAAPLEAAQSLPVGWVGEVDTPPTSLSPLVVHVEGSGSGEDTVQALIKNGFFTPLVTPPTPSLPSTSGGAKGGGGGGRQQQQQQQQVQRM